MYYDNEYKERYEEATSFQKKYLNKYENNRSNLSQSSNLYLYENFIPLSDYLRFEKLDIDEISGVLIYN